MLCRSARAVAGVNCELIAAPAKAAIAIHMCMVELMTAEITRRVLGGYFVAGKRYCSCRQTLLQSRQLTSMRPPGGLSASAEGDARDRRASARCGGGRA